MDTGSTIIANIPCLSITFTLFYFMYGFFVRGGKPYYVVRVAFLHPISFSTKTTTPGHRLQMDRSPSWAKAPDLGTCKQ